MKAVLKSELHKLLSVRSTYIIAGLAFLLISGLFSFYVEGYWGGSGSPAGEASETALFEITLNSFSIIAIFVAIIAMLQVVHEYRHNTIIYTLTASNGRTKAFLAKILVVVGFCTIFALFITAVSLGMYMLGLSLRDASLPTQSISWTDVIARGLFYDVAYVSIGIIIAYLSRNIAAAIALLLIVPSVVEPLLAILLKDNATYLPFAAIDKVVAIEGTQSFATGGELSTSAAALVSLGYLAAGFIITWVMFLRRDATS